MKKIFNLLVQVSIEDTGRENIIKHLDNISNNINVAKQSLKAKYMAKLL